MISKEQAEAIVAKLAQRNQSTGNFDSHEFIDLFRAMYEHEYISMLVENDTPTSNNTAFQSTNSQIAKFLSENSAKLKIKKTNTSSSMNDHGNITSNAKWTFLSKTMSVILLFIFGLSTVFSQDFKSKDQFDVPLSKSLFFTMYIPDTAYIKKDMLLLQDFINEGYSRKNPLYKHLENLYKDYSRELYGFKINMVSKTDIHRAADLCISAMHEIINKTKGGLEFTSDEVKENMNLGYRYNYNSKYFFNRDSLVMPFYTMRITNSDYISYKFPLIDFIRKEPLSWNIYSKETVEIYEMDKENMVKGFEWIKLGEGDRYIKNECNCNFVKKTYPVETSYYVCAQHPEYAINRSKINNGYVWSLYNLQGELMRIHTFYDDMKDEIKQAQNISYWEDYKNNRYNIASEPLLTKQYVEMILSGKMDSVEAEYIGTMLGMALVGAVATELSSYNPGEATKIRNKASEGALKTSNDLIKNIDKEKMKRARKYVEQLEADHRTDFYKGRCIRIDDTSFYYSLVNEQGKASCIFKVKYIQDGPFKVKKNISLIEKRM